MSNTAEAQGTIASNIERYASALADILSSLTDEDQRIAALALEGIQAEVERVDCLESVVSIGFQITNL